MNTRTIRFGLVTMSCLLGLGGFLSNQALGGERVAWGCATCHVKPGKPTAATLDGLSSFSDWEQGAIANVGTTQTSTYTYVTACRTVSTQQLIAYPDNPERQKYLYIYDPATKQFWGRCKIDRPAGAKAEWSFRIAGKWSEESRSDLLVPGTQRKLAEPPPLAPVD